MSHAPKALALVLIALSASLALAPAPAHAGCIVLKNGEVLVGRVRADEVTNESITMRWPYKTRTERGEIEVPKFRVRWSDPKADEPTDTYWREFGCKDIDSEWLPLYERWKIRNQTPEPEGGIPFPPIVCLGNTSLTPIPVESVDFKILKPEGWTSTIDENGITIFVSDKPGTDGFRARIHVFAANSVGGQRLDVVRLIEKEVASVVRGSGTFEIQDKFRMKQKGATGANQEMTTLTKRFDRPVMTLRNIMFRTRKTYFFSAYAHQRDYKSLEPLFKECLSSLAIKEDAKGKTKRTPARPKNRPS